MKKYSFNDFVTDLINRREFDIIYKDEKYGISWFGGGKISFAKYNNPSICQYFNAAEELIENARLNNHLLSEVWNDIQLDIMY